VGICNKNSQTSVTQKHSGSGFYCEFVHQATGQAHYPFWPKVCISPQESISASAQKGEQPMTELDTTSRSNRAPAGFKINPTVSGNFEVKIWGKLNPGWIGVLSSGLSRNRISIIKGKAQKSSNFWDSIFEIEKTRFATDPQKLDILALAREENETTADNNFSISRFSLEPPERHNGALFLEVQAEDQLGFLGQLLNRLAFLLLFPEEISIDTVQGRIFDKFWIKGLGGTPPSSTAQAALKRKLDEWQRI
jgi:UTP:GlnB (protein PII) uridylyltransferase